MTCALADRYRRWFQYEKDSHRKVLNSFLTVPAEQRSSPSSQKVVDLFAHLIQARRLWLFRFGVLAEGPLELFPTGVAIETLQPLADQLHTAWTTYLDRLDETELARVFD